MLQPKLLSIIIPVYNESPNIPVIYKALATHIEKLLYKFEIIFVDDGSRDDSAQQVTKLQKKDQCVRLVEFSRNFGKEAAVSAGLHAAKGQAAIILDADLQHPPQYIPTFIKEWEQGAEIVVGVRLYNEKESWLKKFASRCFYKIMNGTSAITPHATDFRLLDRAVINAFNKFTERNRMARGLIDWLGFKQVFIQFKTAQRAHGTASYGYGKLCRLALNSIASHSLLPLRIAGFLGIVILFIAGPLGAFIFYEKYIALGPDSFNFTGTAALAVIVLFLIGVVLVCLGLIAMYIARIYEEVKNRPLYIAKTESPMDDEVEILG
jgi:dolichol-phosphate mannosyltransferase